ncbi:MAG TPA: alpha/beta hydrolase, partial [Candidatus Agrococcus pullicola]|nr:alpha/beta hydrolase [Candidatus Agrococcus pullicola]
MAVTSPFQQLLDRTPVRRRSNVVDGVATVWFEYGPESGRPLAFVHGFRGDHHGLETIAAHLPGYRILIPDLPGFGESA